MQSLASQPYAKRPVPTPANTTTPAWAATLAAWLGTEFANVQRGMTRAPSRTVTSATTATASDGLILADATSAPVTVTLPDPRSVPDMAVTIKRTNGGGNAVTVGGTVDGTLNRTLASQYAAMTVWSDGTVWWRVAVV